MTRQDIEDVADLINRLHHAAHDYRSDGAASRLIKRLIDVAARDLRRLEDADALATRTRVGVAAEARRVAKRDEFRSPEVIAEEAIRAVFVAPTMALDYAALEARIVAALCKPPTITPFTTGYKTADQYRGAN